MRFASLASGSEGNALVVEAGATRVMLDCGLGLRETVSRLARAGLGPEDVSGIVVTHEHDDHVGGVARFAKKYGIPVWLTFGTFRSQEQNFSTLPGVGIIDCHSPFSIGDLEITPFQVPHDAREPVQFVFSDGAKRLGVLTDAGTATPHIDSMLTGCQALVLECNHDSAMLAASSYPKSLIRRISGRFGHLDNEAAARLLQRIDVSRLQHVVAAHLSQQNNTPSHAATALSEALGCEPEWVAVADQAGSLGWRQLS